MKKKISHPVTVLKIDDEGFHIFCKVNINRKKALLLLDTGASRTVLDQSRIHRFTDEKNFERNEQLSTGLGTDNMESHSTILKRFSVGKIILKNYKVVLIDISHVNFSYSKIGLPPIDGVLGSDLLFQFKAVIDFEKKELRMKE